MQFRRCPGSCCSYFCFPKHRHIPHSERFFSEEGKFGTGSGKEKPVFRGSLSSGGRESGGLRFRRTPFGKGPPHGIVWTSLRSKHPEGPGDFSGEHNGVFYRLEMDVEQPGVFKQPVIVQGRDVNDLFPEGRDKGVAFSLQNHRLTQVQRPTMSIQAFEAEECRQNEGRAAATSQDRDRNVPKSLNEANAVADARGSVYDSCKLA